MTGTANELPLAPPAATATDVETPAVAVRRLVKTIDERTVLSGVDLSVAPGEYVGIVGANGAGKSTLLKILATLVPATSGTVQLFGQPLAGSAVSLRARIGLVGHQSMLYRDLSALENLEFFAKLYGLSEPRLGAAKMLERIGLAARADDPVKSFSRGMTQRVAIARALLHDPELILADEPFDGLDAPSTRSLEQLFSQLSTSGKTVLLVNHDIEQTLRIADRVIVLRGGRVVVDQLACRAYAEEILAEVS